MSGSLIRMRSLAVTATLAVAITLPACGEDTGDDDAERAGDGAESFVCPLSSTQVAAIVGNPVSGPEINDYEGHDLLDEWGETLRGCDYFPISDDPGTVTITIDSIDAETDASYISDFEEIPPTLEAHGRIWKAKASQNSFSEGAAEEMDQLEVYEQEILDTIAAGNGTPETDGY